MTIKHIGVIVVTHNSEEHVAQLLDSLPSALGDLRATVVVVDNGSTDRTHAIVQERTDCQLIQSANGGYANGINQGVRALPAADGWFIANPDLVCCPGSINTLAQALDDPSVGVVGPRVVSPSGELQPSMRRTPTLARNTGLAFTGVATLSEYVDDPCDYTTDRDADWLLGAALVVTRRCWENVGLWDESLFLYSEETDFCLRATDAGWRVRYVSGATVVHEGGGSGRSSKTHTMQIINRVRIYRRRHGLLASAVYYALTVASELSWRARGASVSTDSIAALIWPSRRPAELNASSALIPR